MSSEDDSTPKDRKWRFWEWVSLFALAAGMLVIWIYAGSVQSSARVFSLLALVGFAAWLGGTVLGFLFGVPRFQAADRGNAQSSRIVPNTNLEQVSDWLTKVIIGATLVQLGDLAAGVGGLSRSIGTDIGAPGASTAVGSVIVFFFFVGFMWGYLWCSLRIFSELADLISGLTAKIEARKSNLDKSGERQEGE